MVEEIKVTFSKIAYVSCSKTQIQKLSHILNPWADSDNSICTTVEDVANAITEREDNSDIYLFLEECLEIIGKKADDVIFST